MVVVEGSHWAVLCYFYVSCFVGISSYLTLHRLVIFLHQLFLVPQLVPHRCDSFVWGIETNNSKVCKKCLLFFV